MHLGTLTGFIKAMDLEQITVVVQDWGGLIGMAAVAHMPERFARLIIMNTGLPTGKGQPSAAFLAWRHYAETHPDMQIGQSILGGMAHPEKITKEIVAAYESPFPDVRYKAGAAMWPLLVPIRPDDPAAAEMRHAREVLSKWDKPALVGFDFYADRSDPRDPSTSGSRGHGTATASVIVSATDADVLGAAPGSTLVPLRVDNDVIHFSWLELLRALYWAVAGGMPVVSMSLGGPWGGGVLRDAIAHATSNGLILIAAVGNQVGSVVYPACLPEVIAVAASNVFDEPWSGSGRGPEVDVSAPGESVGRSKGWAPGTFAEGRGEGTSYWLCRITRLYANLMRYKNQKLYVIRTFSIMYMSFL